MERCWDAIIIIMPHGDAQGAHVDVYVYVYVCTCTVPPQALGHDVRVRENRDGFLGVCGVWYRARVCPRLGHIGWG